MRVHIGPIAHVFLDAKSVFLYNGIGVSGKPLITFCF